MATTKFQRKQEDFVCEHCGASVKGNGYTNHCPQCLWSKHVDVFPGDRDAGCGGMMEPESIEGTTPNYRIVHKCSRCGFARRNNVSSEDNVDAILAIIRKNAAK